MNVPRGVDVSLVDAGGSLLVLCFDGRRSARGEQVDTRVLVFVKTGFVIVSTSTLALRCLSDAVLIARALIWRWRSPGWVLIFFPYILVQASACWLGTG